MCSQTNPKKVHPNLAIVIVSAVLRPEEGLWFVCACVWFAQWPQHNIHSIFCMQAYACTGQFSVFVSWLDENSYAIRG